MSSAAMITIRCHYDGKTLVPDEPVELSQGEALIAHVERSTPASPSGDSSSLMWLFEHAVDDPSIPSDLSLEHDHYLYGTPKKK